MKKIILGAALVALIGADVSIAGDAPAGVRRTELQRWAAPDSKYITIFAQVEVAPGNQSGLHTHPGVEMTAVASGQVTVQIQGQPDRTYKAGESIIIPAGVPHNGIASGTTPFVGYGVYVVEADKPLATPVK